MRLNIVLNPPPARGPRWRLRERAALLAVAVVASVALAAGLAAAVPQEAPMFRSVETKRFRTLPPNKLPKFYGRHPNPTRREILPLEIPGGVQQPTKRETALRWKLRKGEKPEPEEFEKTVQVFAQRARQEVKYLAVQRREFIRRAKRWAGEMILQDMEPSTRTLQILLLGCASVGDVSGAAWWARWMERNDRPLGRLEFDAVIAAHGVEGQPGEARAWLERMRNAGFKPDARSYAGLVEAWERIGNRKRMLEVLVEMRDAEATGELGDPMDPRDAALPYYAMARSYMKVADAPRTLAILKHLQVKEVPLTYEAHKLRLEVHLRTPPGPRRNIHEIERALYDTVRSRPKNGALYNSKLAKMCRYTLGNERYEEILRELSTTDEELVPELPGPDAAERWRRASIQAALRGPNTGKNVIQRKNEDERWFRKRINDRKAVRMGKIETGYRLPGDKGLPEWMTMPKPERFGY